MARSRNAAPTLFERRTLIVWASLVASLSLISGLLFALDPTPHAPAVGPVLTALNPSADDLQSLLTTNTTPAADRWQAIVVHHSAQTHGSAEALGRQHQVQGLGGLGYHFVIGNGDGAYDGEIQTGYRWPRQLDGAYHGKTIAICLIGNLDQTPPTPHQKEQLVELVTTLQRRLGIPADRVYLHREVSKTTSPGLLFDASWFRKQLVH